MEFHSFLPRVFESKFSTIEAMEQSRERAKKLKLEIQNELIGNLQEG
jgi:hypothetical protein